MTRDPAACPRQGDTLTGLVSTWTVVEVHETYLVIDATIRSRTDRLTITRQRWRQQVHLSAQVEVAA